MSKTVSAMGSFDVSASEFLQMACSGRMLRADDGYNGAVANELVGNFFQDKCLKLWFL
jgi:hypothetical protein